MHQIPIQLLHQIKARTAWGQTFLSMSQADLDHAMQKHAQAMQGAGYDNKVILAYQMVLPLLVEREAIDELISDLERPDLRGVLPEVLDRNEAVLLMQRELRLTKSQADSLRKILPSRQMSEEALEVLGMWRHGLRKTAA